MSTWLKCLVENLPLSEVFWSVVETCLGPARETTYESTTMESLSFANGGGGDRARSALDQVE